MYLAYDKAGLVCKIHFVFGFMFSMQIEFQQQLAEDIPEMLGWFEYDVNP